jgi:hypothetical protein
VQFGSRIHHISAAETWYLATVAVAAITALVVGVATVARAVGAWWSVAVGGVLTPGLALVATHAGSGWSALGPRTYGAMVCGLVLACGGAASALGCGAAGGGLAAVGGAFKALAMTSGMGVMALVVGAVPTLRPGQLSSATPTSSTNAAPVPSSSVSDPSGYTGASSSGDSSSGNAGSGSTDESATAGGSSNGYSSGGSSGGSGTEASGPGGSSGADGRSNTSAHGTAAPDAGQSSTPVTITEGHDVSPGDHVLESLEGYFGDINARIWQGAWDWFSPDEQQRVTQQRLAQVDANSDDSNIVLTSATGVGTGAVTAIVTFVAADTSQPGANCAKWTLVYSLVQRGDGWWLIDLAEPQAAQPKSSAGTCP